MTKKKDPPNIGAMLAPYPGKLAEPVVVYSDASDKEFRQALNACDAKLPALAEHYGIDLSELHGPLLLCLALAKAHVPGFQIRMKRSPPRKPPDLDLTMSVLLEGARQKDGRRGFKHRLAKQLAEDETRALAKNEGRQRPTQAEIDARTLTRANDLSRLGTEAHGIVARLIIDGLAAGKSLEQIAEEASEITGNLSHENPPRK